MKKAPFHLLTLLSIICLLTGDVVAGEMQASVQGNALTSTAFLEGTIIFGDGLSYVDSEKFILYEVANCEIHLFAEIDEKRVKRLYWIQYEGYLPENDYTYDYSDSKEQTEIGGHLFHDDTWFMDVERSKQRRRSGSDTEHVMQLLEKKGYQVGAGLMGIRLVHLDEPRRQELMIIYYEDLADHGLSVADLSEGGEAAKDWPEIRDRLRQRALDGMDISLASGRLVGQSNRGP